MELPYLRFRQALRLAAETVAHAEHGKWIQSAFVGWQITGMIAKANEDPKRRKRWPDFGQYLKTMKLDKVTQQDIDVAAEKQSAVEAVEAVREAFKRKAMRPSTMPPM